jgi:divalent metal cation (Fe/Co/Zn/Cd) transporter
MTERPPAKPFRDAALTVGTAAVISAVLIFLQIHSHVGEWPALIFIVPILIAVPALLLLPIAYTRYKNGPPPRLSSSQHLTRALLWACLAALGIMAGFLKHESWDLLLALAIEVTWLISAFDHFRKAFRKSEDLPGLQ